jgi:chromosome partitioning protein
LETEEHAMSHSPPDRPLSVVSSNRKGGTGKTSTLYHLSGVLAVRGQRVLLIDGDPQASLTQAFLPSSEAELLPDSATLTGLFNERLRFDPAAVIRRTEVENIWLVAANANLTGYNHAHPREHGSLQDVLRLFLREQTGFDCVLIDTPPNLQLLTWAAMVAADYVISPVIPEDFAAQGLLHVKKIIDEVRMHRNANLEWLGLVLTMVQPRLSVHIAYEEMIRKAYGERVMDGIIPQSTVFKEAIACRKPVSFYKPKGAPAKAVEALAEEIYQRAGRVLSKPQPV